MQNCCRRVFFQVQNNDLHTTPLPSVPIDKHFGFCSVWLVLAVCGSAPLANAVLFFASEHPKSLLPSFYHPPPPPVFSLYAHHLHNPFNLIFTDLEIAFRQLWMLKETNLLPNPGPSAAGPRRQSGCKNDSSGRVVLHNFTWWQYTRTTLCIQHKPPKAQLGMLPTDCNLPMWI